MIFYPSYCKVQIQSSHDLLSPLVTIILEINKKLLKLGYSTTKLFFEIRAKNEEKIATLFKTINFISECKNYSER